MKTSKKQASLVIDTEIAEFEEALLRSLNEAKQGEYARVSSPEDIVARRKGRPVGSVKTSHKAPVTLRINADALATWRASGKGWQTRAANVLESWLKTHSLA